MSETAWNWQNLRRLVLLATLMALSALFAVLSASATEPPREPDLEMGARLVEARCVVCHRQESLPEFVDRCTSDHGEAYLDEFLKRHHASDDEARENIIAYLTCSAQLLPSE